MTNRGSINKSGTWRPYKQVENTSYVMRPQGQFIEGVYIPVGKTLRWRDVPLHFENPTVCNSIQKQKYKPECAKTQEEKNNRRRKINTLVRYYEKMKQRERWQFMRKIHERTAEEWWITEHYYVDNPNILENGTVLGEIKYSKTPIRGSHRQNVQHFFTSQNLEKIKLNKVPNARSELTRILQIFESKISFHYNDDVFIAKINRIHEFMREKGITKSILINDGLFEFFGNDELENIFGPDIYLFLKENGILTQKLLNQYQELLAINGDKNRRMKLKYMWYKSYQSRIEILFEILRIPMENRDVFIYMVENMLKLELIMRVYQYIYYSNEYLKEENIPPGKTREMMIEIAFEYVYYHNLNFYLDFCRMFLGCIDKEINRNRIGIGKGAIGEIYKIDRLDGQTVIEKKMQNVRTERMLFEFFKQICLYEIFSENITEPIEFIFGYNEIYIQMIEIDGENVLKYILEDKIFITLTNEKKYEILKNISIEISNVLLKFQDKIQFIHYDFNPRNIMIKVEWKEGNRIEIEKIKVIFIDFDKTFFKLRDMYIYTFNRFLYPNIFGSEDFNRSIDLFRYIAEICNLKNNISTLKSNKYKNLRNNNIEKVINNSIGTENLKKIIMKFFNIVNRNRIEISIEMIRIMIKLRKKDYSKFWDVFLSSMNTLRKEVFREISIDLVPPKSNLYIDRFIPIQFNKVW